MSYPNFAGPSTSQFSIHSSLSQPSGFYPSQSSYPGPSQPSQLPYAPNPNPQEARIPTPSMSEVLLDPLARLQSLSTTLFLSLGPPQSRPPPPPALSDLVAADASLADAARLARAHQVRQRRIVRLQDEVLALDRRWRDVVHALDDGRRALAEIVREGEERIKAIEEAQAGECPLFLLLLLLGYFRERMGLGAWIVMENETDWAAGRSLQRRRRSAAFVRARSTSQGGVGERPMSLFGRRMLRLNGARRAPGGTHGYPLHSAGTISFETPRSCPTSRTPPACSS